MDIYYRQLKEKWWISIRPQTNKQNIFEDILSHLNYL